MKREKNYQEFKYPVQGRMAVRKEEIAEIKQYYEAGYDYSIICSSVGITDRFLATLAKDGGWKRPETLKPQDERIFGRVHQPDGSVVEHNRPMGV